MKLPFGSLGLLKVNSPVILMPLGSKLLCVTAVDSRCSAIMHKIILLHHRDLMRGKTKVITNTVNKLNNGNRIHPSQRSSMYTTTLKAYSINHKACRRPVVYHFTKYRRASPSKSDTVYQELELNRVSTLESSNLEFKFKFKVLHWTKGVVNKYWIQHKVIIKKNRTPNLTNRYNSHFVHRTIPRGRNSPFIIKAVIETLIICKVVTQSLKRSVNQIKSESKDFRFFLFHISDGFHIFHISLSSIE